MTKVTDNIIPAAFLSQEQPTNLVYLADDYNWAVSVFDTSRILTFVVSLTLIIYGSLRAIKIEECNEEEDENENDNSKTTNISWQNLHTIEATQAVALPLCASILLLVMFFFFDSLQLLFTLMMTVLATVASAFLLLPICQYATSLCFNNANKISLGCCGRFTPAEISALLTSSVVVMMWVFTGHWLLMDVLSMALCVAMIAIVRLPSLKVSVLLLFGLLVYDVFWVFLSEYIFNVNVMVTVATQPAYNPLHYLTNRLHVRESMQAPLKISLPAKLIFPRKNGHFSMLGLGDVVMPGLLLCFVLRFDKYKEMSASTPATITYFHCSLLGYFVGLLTATLVSEASKSAQPALLYLVPFTLLPIVIRAYLQGDLRKMWTSPFVNVTSKCLDV